MQKSKRHFSPYSELHGINFPVTIQRKGKVGMDNLRGTGTHRHNAQADTNITHPVRISTIPPDGAQISEGHRAQFYQLVRGFIKKAPVFCTEGG